MHMLNIPGQLFHQGFYAGPLVHDLWWTLDKGPPPSLVKDWEEALAATIFKPKESARAR